MTIHPAATAAMPLTATTVSTGSGVDAAIAWGGVVASLLVAAGLFLITWRQLNGRHRRWVVASGIPFQISHRNTWPFMILGFGLFFVMLAVATVFEALGNEAGRQFIWSWPAFVPLALVVLSFFTWPLALTPDWYQRWARHPQSPQVSPWPLEEAAQALTDAPDDRSRAALGSDIGWSGQDSEKAWELTGLPGTAPKTRFDERTEELKAKLAQHEAERQNRSQP
ncbi:hypothetical protein AB0K08_12055 [Citricoccus sp. NPDC055426]|uniref:hypothetical protein n=1 Tax=Citricoccus sp. NPDC055426 TaxID=3155536 RepID=UPI003419AF16